MNKKDKVLFFITDNYPFGYGESFIENEIPYLANNFKKIFIISRNSFDTQTRQVPKNCEIYRVKRNYFSLIDILFDRFYLYDFIKNFQKYKPKIFLKFQFNSKIIENEILKVINKNSLKKNEVIVYSYWFYYGAYVASILKRKGLAERSISRAHGYDLYLERGEQPFKNEILKSLNMVYPCSKKGENYLKNIYKKNNITCSYLGTINKQKFKLKSKNFTIVSCSNLIPLKRVELIILTLSKLEKKYKNLKWVHFGSGIEEEKIKNLAKQKLKKMTYEFKGEVKNKKVLEYYKNNDILLFLHLSSSEGLPVSMMEAQSFGIPIVATNVGGVDEIVNKKTGILLSANPTIKEIVIAIEKIINLSNEDYIYYQLNSYNNWRKNFNADLNYGKLLSIFLFK